MTNQPAMTGRAEHIAIVLPDFSSGGTERTAIRLAGAWTQRGRRVTLLCGSERGPARVLVAPGIAVLSHRPEIRGGLLYRVRLGQAFAKLVATVEPDLVFGIGNFHIPVLAWIKMVLPKGGPPLVCRLSNRLHKPGLDRVSQATFSAIIRLASRRVDALVAMSGALQKEARTILGRDDVASIPEPNLPDGYVPTAPPWSGRNDPLIVCAGRLERQKRFELALRAFAALPPSRNARLLILGEGSRRTSLEREAAKLGISDRVEFAGYVADIRPHLARAQLFLCVSHYEGYPAVLVEAIAAGLKVVTTDCSPAIAEIMFDRSFGRITGSDAASIARAIEALFDEPGPDLAARGRLIAQHQLWRSADAYLAVFDRLVAERRVH
jgi:glycosyltransferase involved in cell wall biosynthesis